MASVLLISQSSYARTRLPFLKSMRYRWNMQCDASKVKLFMDSIGQFTRRYTDQTKPGRMSAQFGPKNALAHR
jgi:hypothetical protein